MLSSPITGARRLFVCLAALLFISAAASAQTYWIPTGNFKNMNRVRSALNFGTVDAAMLDCGSSTNCTVRAEAGMSAGTPTFTNWTDNIGLFDLRGSADQDAANFDMRHTVSSIWQKKTTDLGGNDKYAPFSVYYVREMGGGSATNASTGANKTTGDAFTADLRSKGYAQDFTVNSNCYKSGSGECFAFAGLVVHSGNNFTYGDEGSKGLKVTVMDADGSGALYTGTVSSYTDNGNGTATLQLSAQSNKTLQGEGRWLIRTDAAAYNTGTAVVSTSASPPTVTISGGTLPFTTGAHTDLCFESTQDRTGPSSAYKYVVPIKSIDSTTALTLNYAMDGGAYTTWSGLATSSSYNIYYCGQIQKLGYDGNGGSTGTGFVTLSKGYTGWAAGQTFEQPLGYANYIVGAQINVQPYVPKANNHSGTIGLWIGSNGAVSADTGMLLTGAIKTSAVYMNNTWQSGQTTYGLHFASNPTNLISIDSFSGTSTVFAQYADSGNFGQLKWYPGGASSLWRFFNNGQSSGYIDMYGDGHIDANKVSARSGLTTVAGTFSTLPSCTGNEGLMRAVTDSTTATWGATITGSGTNHVLAYCDGTNWTVAAK